MERPGGGLLAGTTCVIFDGNPAAARSTRLGHALAFCVRNRRDLLRRHAFYAACMKAGITPQDCGDLSRIRVLGSTGSPLSAEVQQWGTRFMAHAGAIAAR